MAVPKLRYIVVEGSIASGKSALSEKLTNYFSALLIKEKPEENPFLLDFYANATNHALAAQLSFLMQREEAGRAILEADANNQRVVSDFLLEKDKIFVPIVLGEKEEKLYWQIKQKVQPTYPTPDLLIYLQASDDVLKKRLSKREKNYQELFPQGYIEQIHDSYRHFFYLYQHAPMIIANTDELDFVGNEDHFGLLIDAIANMQGSKLYLNLNTNA
ncbi:deoxynucleoside kinase [Neisseria sp. Ec49-e6-T10]|uniref:deoxynucleoside kinase n=1 Tax=Neisseria sp. Ec49-e6-T10 TaxID=3140744 RepID=UPI003EB87CD2